MSRMSWTQNTDVSQIKSQLHTIKPKPPELNPGLDVGKTEVGLLPWLLLLS